MKETRISSPWWWLEFSKVSLFFITDTSRPVYCFWIVIIRSRGRGQVRDRTTFIVNWSPKDVSYSVYLNGKRTETKRITDWVVVPYLPPPTSFLWQNQILLFWWEKEKVKNQMKIDQHLSPPTFVLMNTFQLLLRCFLNF